MPFLGSNPPNMPKLGGQGKRGGREGEGRGQLRPLFLKFLDPPLVTENAIM